MSERSDYFFAAFDSSLRHGAPPMCALQDAVEDYAAVFYPKKQPRDPEQQKVPTIIVYAGEVKKRAERDGVKHPILLEASHAQVRELMGWIDPGKDYMTEDILRNWEPRCRMQPLIANIPGLIGCWDGVLIVEKRRDLPASARERVIHAQGRIEDPRDTTFQKEGGMEDVQRSIAGVAKTPPAPTADVILNDIECGLTEMGELLHECNKRFDAVLMPEEPQPEDPNKGAGLRQGSSQMVERLCGINSRVRIVNRAIRDLMGRCTL